MNFELVNDEYYLNLTKHLVKKVPEFKASFDPEDGLYLVISEFGRFIVAHINDETILSQCIDFINESIEKGGHETRDLISLEISELLNEEPLLAQKAKAKLSDKALSLFNM
jgi:hypothetical protein